MRKFTKSISRFVSVAMLAVSTSIAAFMSTPAQAQHALVYQDYGAVFPASATNFVNVFPTNSLGMFPTNTLRIATQISTNYLSGGDPNFHRISGFVLNTNRYSMIGIYAGTNLFSSGTNTFGLALVAVVSSNGGSWYTKYPIIDDSTYWASVFSVNDGSNDTIGTQPIVFIEQWGTIP